MRNTNKKGFTIVELVIVVAVIAILAAVLIPTFSGIIRKANISSDTVVAKNLNTAAISAGAKNFDSAIAAVKEAGYVLANLNAKASGCYFVWDDVNDQFLLVDTTDGYKVIYSNTEASAKSNWFVAVNDPEAVAAIEAAGCQVKKIATSYEDLMANIAAGGEQTIYVDESVVLDDDNLIVFDNANAEITLNLGNASLNTNGILKDKIPINVVSGTVNIKDGIIGAAGSYVDADGKVVNTPVQTIYGSVVNIYGTTFNTNSNGYAYFGGEANVENATFNAQNIGIYVGGCSQTTLKDTTIISNGRCVWSCNIDWIDEAAETYGHVGNAKLTIKSGTYKGGNNTWNPIAACGGQIVIEGGTFEGVNGIFTLQNASETESIVITGGTFNGKAFAELDTVDEWKALCNDGVTVVIEAGKVTITK